MAEFYAPATGQDITINNIIFNVTICNIKDDYFHLIIFPQQVPNIAANEAEKQNPISDSKINAVSY